MLFKELSFFQSLIILRKNRMTGVKSIHRNKSINASINDIHFTDPCPTENKGKAKGDDVITTGVEDVTTKSVDRTKSLWAGRRQEGRAESSGDGSSRVGRHRPAIKALSHRGVDVTRR